MTGGVAIDAARPTKRFETDVRRLTACLLSRTRPAGQAADREFRRLQSVAGNEYARSIAEESARRLGLAMLTTTPAVFAPLAMATLAVVAAAYREVEA